MGEELHEIEQLHEGIVLDLHGDMLRIEHDAVLIVIHIRRILEAPRAVVDGDGDDAVVLSGGMVYPARIALVLHAQLTLGIRALLRVSCRRDGLGILLRLGQVDGDVQIAVFGMRHPFLVAADAVTADVVRVLAEFIKIFGRLLRRIGIMRAESADDLAGTGNQRAHDLRIKKIPVYHAVILQKPVVRRIIQHILQDALQLRDQLRLLAFIRRDGRVRVLQLVQAKQLQQAVRRINRILRLDQAGGKSISH